eukprot:10320620-Prorocentrum_lima.AAC.1
MSSLCCASRAVQAWWAAAQLVRRCSDPASPMEQSGHESTVAVVSRYRWAYISRRRPASVSQQ